MRGPPEVPSGEAQLDEAPSHVLFPSPAAVVGGQPESGPPPASTSQPPAGRATQAASSSPTPVGKGEATLPPGPSAKDGGAPARGPPPGLFSSPSVAKAPQGTSRATPPFAQAQPGPSCAYSTSGGAPEALPKRMPRAGTGAAQGAASSSTDPSPCASTPAQGSSGSAAQGPDSPREAPAVEDSDDDEPNHDVALGVDLDATADVIKRAYRALAIRLHLDKHGGTAEATRAFQQALSWGTLRERAVMTGP